MLIFVAQFPSDLTCCRCTETTDEEQCNSSLLTELSKLPSQRDRPRMKKLFRATFILRRNVVITVEDGAVQTLIEKFPLLADMEFVSFYVFVLLKKNLNKRWHTIRTFENSWLQ
jgi:hypothetical protein